MAEQKAGDKAGADIAELGTPGQSFVDPIVGFGIVVDQMADWGSLVDMTVSQNSNCLMIYYSVFL